MLKSVFSYSWDKYPEFLDYMGTFILSSTVAAPIYKPNNSAEGFLPFSPCPHEPYDFTQMWNMKNQNKQ